jgi:hypothetical protein
VLELVDVGKVKGKFNGSKVVMLIGDKILDKAFYLK